MKTQIAQAQDGTWNLELDTNNAELVINKIRPAGENATTSWNEKKDEYNYVAVDSITSESELFDFVQGCKLLPSEQGSPFASTGTAEDMAEVSRLFTLIHA